MWRKLHGILLNITANCAMHKQGHPMLTYHSREIAKGRNRGQEFFNDSIERHATSVYVETVCIWHYVIIKARVLLQAVNHLSECLLIPSKALHCNQLRR